MYMDYSDPSTGSRLLQPEGCVTVGREEMVPELPEVESIVRALNPRLSGTVVEGLEIFWPRSLEGSLEEISSAIRGLPVSRVFRRGKYVCLRLTGKHHLTIHLRMSGSLILNPEAGDGKHTRARFFFSNGIRLDFIDPRKFGRIRFWKHGEPFLSHLGPEPLDGETVFSILNNLRSRRVVKTILLDQHILAGLGNIYVDESLFAAGVHPLTRVNELSSPQKKKLSLAIPRILRAAIRMRGTTLNDYRDPDQRTGQFQEKLQVYQRGGQPCFLCGTAIRRMVVAQRGTHFCPECQPNPLPAIFSPGTIER